MKISKLAMSIGLVLSSSMVLADDFADAVTGGKTTLDMNLRYEFVDQDNDLKNANALTLRTRLNYTTAAYNGVVGVIEFEDSRAVAGVDDYNNTLGKNTDYSVVADPETTELDQAYLQYKYAGLTAKGGRQIMTFDNHRFVGHVGWRQDRQTFDGLGLSYNISDVVQLDYAYIDQRNRIFAEAKDINSKDNLINASYKTGLGKFTGYAYLLEEDTEIDNGIDTYGIRFSGDAKLAETKVLYTAEYAMQDTDEMGVSYSTNYLALEAGAVFAGFTAKLGYELLGSDDGNYGFATPLATLHKFNGWSDQFLTTPTQGLADIYASVSGKVASGTLTLAYHDFSADESSSTIDDFGSEIDASYVLPLTKNYKVGLKYASYFAGDAATNKVDTSKVWLWLNAKF